MRAVSVATAEVARLANRPATAVIAAGNGRGPALAELDAATPFPDGLTNAG